MSSEPTEQRLNGGERKRWNWRSHIRFLPLLSLALGIGVAAVVAARAGASVADVARALPANAHLLAFTVMAVELGARGMRWVLLARGVGVPLRFRTSLLAQLAGEAAGAVTPSRMGTEPAKIAIVTRSSITVASAGAILAGELLAEASMLMVTVLALSTIVPAGERLPVLGVLVYATMMACGALSVVVLARARPKRTPPGWWTRLRLSERQWRRLRVTSHHLRYRVKRLRRLSGTAIASVLVVTAIHIAARLSVLPVMASTVETPTSVIPLVTWPLFFFYAGTLVPSPGGGGTIELGFAHMLGGFLTARSMAGLLVWWRFYTFYLGAMIGGIAVAVTALRGRTQRRRARALARAAENAEDPPAEAA